MVTTFHSSLIEDIKHYETSDARKRIKEFVTNTYYKSVLQRFLDRSQALTAVSSSVAVEIGRYFNRAGLHIPVIPNGVDTQFFEPTGKENGSRVLFVGRLSERKGIIDFMECAEIVHSYHPEAEFLVAGEGPMREALVQRAAKSSASARIHLLGWCSRVQLRDLYQSCSVFVCPSRYEAGPLTLLEAMSSGTSVVSTSVGEANEAIQDGYNGLLVQPAAPRDLAGAVIRLLDDHELRVTVGHNARETVIKRYTWSAAAALLLQVYAQVLGGVG
jgi:glycosyltransferase involved in cell wall biosynthesis